MNMYPVMHASVCVSVVHHQWFKTNQIQPVWHSLKSSLGLIQM